MCSRATASRGSEARISLPSATRDRSAPFGQSTSREFIATSSKRLLPIPRLRLSSWVAILPTPAFSKENKKPCKLSYQDSTLQRRQRMLDPSFSEIKL
jgi:hypothetical protein